MPRLNLNSEPNKQKRKLAALEILFELMKMVAEDDTEVVESLLDVNFDHREERPDSFIKKLTDTGRRSINLNIEIQKISKNSRYER